MAAQIIKANCSVLKEVLFSLVLKERVEETVVPESVLLKYGWISEWLKKY